MGVGSRETGWMLAAPDHHSNIFGWLKSKKAFATCVCWVHKLDCSPREYVHNSIFSKYSCNILLFFYISLENSVWLIWKKNHTIFNIDYVFWNLTVYLRCIVNFLCRQILERLSDRTSCQHPLVGVWKIFLLHVKFVQYWITQPAPVQMFGFTRHF